MVLVQEFCADLLIYFPFSDSVRNFTHKEDVQPVKINIHGCFFALKPTVRWGIWRRDEGPEAGWPTTRNWNLPVLNCFTQSSKEISLEVSHLTLLPCRRCVMIFIETVSHISICGFKICKGYLNCYSL